MEARIDASLARLRTDMDAMRTEAAKRETRLILSIAAMMALGMMVLALILD